MATPAGPATIARQRPSDAPVHGRGRPYVLPDPVDLSIEVAALVAERQEDARRMAKVIPFLRFGRVSATDVAAEQALGIVQLEVERIARRSPGPAA